MALLEIEGLKTYFFTTQGAVKAVDDVSISLKKGESLGIAGESGCGKSTLAYSIIRLIPPPGKIVDGKIIFDGKDLTAMNESSLRKEIRWNRISMIFQGAMNALTPVYTIGEQIVEAILYHEKVSKEEAKKRVAELLGLVGIEPERAKSYPHELSGGMKQRAMIAMALALTPDLAIADEPSTALDVVVQSQIMNIMKRLQHQMDMSIILITHDLSLIAELADKIAIMYAGKIVEHSYSENIYGEPLHPYTQSLLHSIPRLHVDISRLEWIPGVPPNLINPPSGCRFAPRCKYAMEVCEKEPPLVEVKPDHFVACWLRGELS